MARRERFLAKARRNSHLSRWSADVLLQVVAELVIRKPQVPGGDRLVAVGLAQRFGNPASAEGVHLLLKRAAVSSPGGLGDQAQVGGRDLTGRVAVGGPFDDVLQFPNVAGGDGTEDAQTPAQGLFGKFSYTRRDDSEQCRPRFRSRLPLERSPPIFRSRTISVNQRPMSGSFPSFPLIRAYPCDPWFSFPIAVNPGRGPCVRFA